MRPSSLPLLLVVLSLSLALGSCASGPEGSRGTGILLTEGGFRANTDEYERTDIITHITSDLDRALAPRWTSHMTIAELPKWQDSAGPEDGHWTWRTITAQVTLSGSGDAPLTPAEVHDAVQTYLTKRGGRGAVVNVTVTSNAGGPTPIAAPAASPAPTPAPAAAPAQAAVVANPAPVPVTAPATGPAVAVAAGTQRTYTVQAGDSLADIATLFYGSPEPWRLILSANPGLDAAKLVPGQVLVIPPKP
jgi:nucleoid-associated protein YgaU